MPLRLDSIANYNNPAGRLWDILDQMKRSESQLNPLTVFNAWSRLLDTPATERGRLMRRIIWPFTTCPSRCTTW